MVHSFDVHLTDLEAATSNENGFNANILQIVTRVLQPKPQIPSKLATTSGDIENLKTP